MIIEALKTLVYVLIFPGFLFCFLTGLLLAGIDRKLVARMQEARGLDPKAGAASRPSSPHRTRPERRANLERL